MRRASVPVRGRFLESATQRSALAPVYTRARSLRKRTHTQPDHTSPVARTFPRLRPQNHLPPHAAHHDPAPHRTAPHRTAPHASLLFAAVSLRRNSQRRERSRNRTTARLAHRLAEGQRWVVRHFMALPWGRSTMRAHAAPRSTTKRSLPLEVSRWCESAAVRSLAAWR